MGGCIISGESFKMAVVIVDCRGGGGDFGGKKTWEGEQAAYYKSKL